MNPIAVLKSPNSKVASNAELSSERDHSGFAASHSVISDSLSSGVGNVGPQ